MIWCGEDRQHCYAIGICQSTGVGMFTCSGRCSHHLTAVQISCCMLHDLVLSNRHVIDSTLQTSGSNLVSQFAAKCPLHGCLLLYMYAHFA